MSSKVVKQQLTSVYEMAIFIAEKGGIKNIIDVGAGNGEKLIPFLGSHEIFATDYGENCTYLSKIEGLNVIDWNLDDGLPPISDGILQDAIVIVADVVEHILDPAPFFRDISKWAKTAKYVLMSTPDRTRFRGIGDQFPLGIKAHVRQWTIDEFSACLTHYGIEHQLIGHTINTQHHGAKETILALAGIEPNPTNHNPIKCLAVVSMFNEADIIIETIEHLLRQGVDVHVVDNWSTDSGYDLVMEKYSDNKCVTLSKFPDQPTGRHEWKNMLDHKVSLAHKSDYDWVMHYDADELRYSPWRDFNLAQAIGWVDSLGYNAIDHTVIDFRFCVDTEYMFPEYENNLLRFEFGRRAGHFSQIKVWKNIKTESPVLSASGGHDCVFSNRRVFPLKFLMKHYPLRSLEHANKKITLDRLPRVQWGQQTHGFHGHYNLYKDNPVTWVDCQLLAWSDYLFSSEYLVERLTGIGIPREDSFIVDQGDAKDSKQIASYIAEIERCKREMGDVHASRSWRYGALFRWFGELFRWIFRLFRLS